MEKPLWRVRCGESSRRRCSSASSREELERVFDIAGDALKILPGGSRFAQGSDQVIIGKALANRIQGCQIGQEILLNTTPFQVVGIFDYDGPFRSEIWGEDRL